MSLGTEARLLLCAARLAPDARRQAELAALLRTPPDWPLLLEQAAAHGLLALLYQHAEAVAPEAVPPGAMAALWQAYEANARRNQAMARELLRVTGLLERHRIASIPYKGPTLAQAVYGDLALRRFSDLDLLVRREDLPKAKDLLADAGYAPAQALSARAEATLLRSPAHYHALWLHRTSGIAVELHWRTDPQCPVEDFCPGLWGRPAAIDFAGGQVRGFRPSELLLLLAVHGSKHHWASLGWLVDVAELARQGGHDWEWIWVVAGQLRARRRLALGLALAHALLDCALPADVLRQVGQAGVGPLAAAVRARMFAAGGMGALARLRLDAGLCDTAGDALAAVGRTLFAPSLAELTRWPLPPALEFLYVPLRVARLAGKHLRGG